MSPAAYRVGLAAALAVRGNDEAGLEALLDELTGVGDIMDATCLALEFAPGHKWARYTDDRLRALLLRQAAAA